MKPLCPGAALALSCLLSCAPFGGEAAVDALIPEPPPHWLRAFPDLRFRLVFLDAAGAEKDLSVSDWKKPVRVSCSRGGNAPVLACPVSDRAGGFLRPAGALFPLDLCGAGDHPALPLSWEAGPTAWICLQLRRLGFDSSLVNAARLRLCLAGHADPWDVDLEKIVETLAGGDFSVYDIDPRESRDVQLIPGAGEWFRESPFRGPLRVSDGETLAAGSLSLGLHAFFSAAGERILVFVGAGGTLICRQRRRREKAAPRKEAGGSRPAFVVCSCTGERDGAAGCCQPSRRKRPRRPRAPAG